VAAPELALWLGCKKTGAWKIRVDNTTSIMTKCELVKMALTKYIKETTVVKRNNSSQKYTRKKIQR
jgi:hypothetical protein